MPSNQNEVDKNYEAFKKELPRLQAHVGKYALLREGEIVEIYETLADAVATAERFYTDGLYSIQRITNDPVDLGYYSHAMPLR